jgi:hypothetical protein
MKNIVIIIAAVILSVTVNAQTTTSSSNNNNKEIVASSNTSSNVITVVINDMNGKVVFTQTFSSNDENGVDLKLNVTNKLAKGTYVVTVIADGQKMTQKLVVE